MRTIWEIITEEARAEEYKNSEGVLYTRKEVDNIVRKAIHEAIDETKQVIWDNVLLPWGERTTYNVGLISSDIDNELNKLKQELQ